MKWKISCWNSECKHYYEDSCMNPKKFIQLNHEGKCMDFEIGKNEAYQEDY